MTNNIEKDVTDAGGIKFTVSVDGVSRTVVLEPQDDGTLSIESVAADGTSKAGVIDPSGGGDNSIGI